MTWQTVPSPSGSASVESQITTLDGVPYLLQFTYSERADVWYLAILTEEGDAIRYGVKLVCGWPLLRKVADPRKPPGVLFVWTANNDDSPPGLLDLAPGGRCTLIYVPQADLVLP